MDSAAVVREARRRSGLTQAALASRARTTQSTIAAYEAGAKQPSADTMSRIAMAAGFAVAWELVPMSSLTARTVNAVADRLGTGADREALRAVVEMADRLDRCSPDEFSADAGADPGSTGDHRYDALVAGIVERAAHRVGARSPAWTASPSRFLDVWWFVSRYRTLHASAIVETPPELANRGVFMHESSLSRV